MSQEILKLENISKSFGRNIVLKDINLRVFRGEVCSVLGENGAGKSTLMKIIAGVYKKDFGKIIVDKEEVEIASPNRDEYWYKNDFSRVPAYW